MSRRRKRNPPAPAPRTYAKRVPIPGARVAVETHPLEPGAPSWKRGPEVHPRRETGQGRLFPREVMHDSKEETITLEQTPGFVRLKTATTSPEYSGQLSDDPRYPRPGDVVDPFVYVEAIDYSEMPLANEKYFERIARKLRPFLQCSGKLAVIMQPALTWEPQERERVENELETLADDLVEHADAMAEAEANRDWTDHFESDFERWLRDSATNGNFGNPLANRIQAFLDAGFTDDDLHEILKDSSLWTLRNGSDLDADFSEDSTREVIFSPNEQDRDDDVVAVKKAVLTWFSEFIPADLLDEAWELWLSEVLSATHSDGGTWKLSHNGDWEIHFDIGAHANIDMHRAIEAIDAAIERHEDEGEDEDEEDEDETEESIVPGDTTVRLDYVFTPTASGSGKDWSVWNLGSADLKDEGERQRHCVGNLPGYGAGIERGEIFIWSVKDSKGKPKFTIEVARSGESIIGFKQVKGKGNRLPGWEFERDYPPYGEDAYKPRLETFTQKTKGGPIVHKPITVDDVRGDEVELLWEFLTNVAPLSVCKEAAKSNGGQWYGDIPEMWNDALDAAMKYETSHTTGNSTARNTLQMFIDIMKDMLPGLFATYGGRLFNAPPEHPRGGVARVRRNPADYVRIEGTTLDRPYRANPLEYRSLSERPKQQRPAHTFEDEEWKRYHGEYPADEPVVKPSTFDKRALRRAGLNTDVSETTATAVHDYIAANPSCSEHDVIHNMVPRKSASAVNIALAILVFKKMAVKIPIERGERGGYVGRRKGTGTGGGRGAAFVYAIAKRP